MQSEIDAGLKWCEPCDQWGRHEFCGHCGKHYVGRDLTWRACPNKSCQAAVTTDWCPLCGTQVSSERLRRFEDGTLDVQGETAIASQHLQRLYSIRPDLGPTPPASTATSLATAVMEIFGDH